jgi:hypothetical protein
LIGLVILCLGLTSLSGQSDLTKKQEAYQNQQRAANLAVIRSNIKLVDDAPVRCFLRLQIIYFIFENKVTKYYDTANSLALECLDETVDNKEQFSALQSNRQKGEILLLLRKYLPETTKKIEKKYFVDDKDTDLAEELAAQTGQDPTRLANRQIAKIAREGVTSSVDSLVYSLRQKNNNAAAVRILTAALDYYESHLEATYEGNALIFLESEYGDSQTPVELRRRFYNLMIRIGEAAIADPDNDDPTRLYIEIMKYTLPDVKQISLDLYPKAFAIYTALSSKKSDEEKEEDEVWERINASKDKLAQTISEAESATNKSLKSGLWMHAAQYALEVKKFRLAAESELKIDFSTFDNKTNNVEADIKDVIRKIPFLFLTQDALDPCLKENDIESAQYIVSLVEDPEIKSQGLFKIAAKLIELKKRETAFDTLYEGWKVLEKLDPGNPSLWTRHLAIPIALKIDKMRAFDMASEIVKAVNRFPTPSPEDKPGTEARRKYADNLTGFSSNLETIFGQLAKEDVSLADAISQGLQLKELRLAAQIAIETHRVYPLPPELLPETPRPVRSAVTKP